MNNDFIDYNYLQIRAIEPSLSLNQVLIYNTINENRYLDVDRYKFNYSIRYTTIKKIMKRM